MFLSVFLIFNSTHNKCSLIVSVMLCTFISFLSVCHNLITTLLWIEFVLPGTLFVSVLCKCTLIIHIERTSTFVIWYFSTHYFFNIYFNINPSTNN